MAWMTNFYPRAVFLSSPLALGEYGDTYANHTDASRLKLINTTSATVGADQQSPSLVLGGQGWKTNATAASQPVAFSVHVEPIQGAAAPYGRLWIMGSINEGNFANGMYYDTNGNLQTTAQVFAGTNVGAASWTYWANSTNYRCAVSASGAGALGTCNQFITAADNTCLLYNSGRTHAAGNVAQAILWDINAATFTDGGKILSVGWLNNADAYQECHYFTDKYYCLPSWAVADAPAAVAGAMAWCTNGDAGAACMTVSDGTNWKVVDINGLANIAAA